MTLEYFLNKFNEDTGWFGLEEQKEGEFKMVKFLDKPYPNPSTGWMVSNRHKYFKIYTCSNCGNKNISEKKYIKNVNVKDPNKSSSCGKGSKCHETWAKDILRNHSMFTQKWSRENPGTDQGGYHYWTENKKKKTMHRVVYEEHYNVKLTKNDYIHHINMNKLDNKIDNLWKCNIANHSIAHWSYNECCEELMNNFNIYSGIKFNKDTGKYYLINKETCNEILC